MGAVYEASDCRLHHIVAVKQMTVSESDADSSFEREARLLAGLRHPGLPVVTDYFTGTDGRFLVMQYIEGEDLARVLREEGRCPVGQVVTWALAVLDALVYLHGHAPPIVHRDLKPANLKRTPRGELILLDFGLAKGQLDSDETVPLGERSLFGFTLQYAPPEQIEGSRTDARSDLFALGATLYHLVAGVPAPSALERLASVRQGHGDPLTGASDAHLPKEEPLRSTITRAMALDPADRFASAADMRAALLRDERGIGTAPSRKLATTTRRVDAAMPSQTEVGRQTDVIVQVRFADSPLLGLEDWPSRRRPAHLEQSSESVQLTYPRDPDSGYSPTGSSAGADCHGGLQD